ncbi:hypothetical protein DAPPUDRAFT_106003 [Daphnia pulex]|uniref:Uncharacterized protein n=1 Tax=Daphnia pulex TaxID=6669 RepID=E9GSG8_DAPPU|nr:hypothetical protein DAPPUDRAFT_106003 [Daphnia pulex]|eukprot:EFX77579.1 hypothetical protein DAPPUDRAFT_106003 [Daphnia pulex]
MGSKKKAEEEVTSESGEHCNPHKKKRIDVAKPNMANSKVKPRADVRRSGNFLLSKLKRFVGFPVLFPETLLYHIIDVLVVKYPNNWIMLKTGKTKNPDCLIPPEDIEPEMFIEVLELFGAAFVFQGKPNFRKLGWICWYEATVLRDKYRITKISLPQSQWETLLFGNVKVHKDARNDQIKIKDYTIKSKADKLEEISQLILILIKLLVSMPKSEAEREKLKYHLKSYTINFENKTLKKKQSTLLLRASEDYRGFEDDFDFIMLLLETGGDPNAVDQNGRSPLHVLASREIFFHPFWSFDYQAHAARFTTIVQTFFDGEFHKDQTDLRGNAALDCIKYFPQQYPNDKLRKLMDRYLQGVLPLSCIAAKVVRKHNLPWEHLPVALQSMVLKHSSFQYC